MRKISVSQIFIFFAITLISLTMGVFSTYALLGKLPLGDFRGIILTIVGIFLIYLFIIIFHRLILKLMPINIGVINHGSRQEFSYHIYLLFYLIFFYPIIRSGFIPIPIMRLFYQALGAKLGKNTYSSGLLLDPSFVEIGDNSLVGQYSLVIPHVIENDKLEHYPIRIGNNVTIGAQSVVMADVTIGDGALVATGAVVKKGSRIGAGEIWGGTPAKKINNKSL